jgi:DNA-binding transcriptional ArsR family regulator
MLPSMLTPFVRSDAVGAILAETFLHPDEELSLAEVGRRTGVAPAVVHKEVSRLVAAGVLSDRRDGNNRLVRANSDHPLFAPMLEIVATVYGPVPVLRDLLSAAPGIASAFIYGSWAARRAGQAGLFPRDIDVMVVGDLSLDDLLDVQQAARERLGIDVNIHRVTLQAWQDRASDPFLAEVASHAMVPLVGEGGGDV